MENWGVHQRRGRARQKWRPVNRTMSAGKRLTVSASSKTLRKITTDDDQGLFGGKKKKNSKDGSTRRRGKGCENRALKPKKSRSNGRNNLRVNPAAQKANKNRLR